MLLSCGILAYTCTIHIVVLEYWHPGLLSGDLGRHGEYAESLRLALSDIPLALYCGVPLLMLIVTLLTRRHLSKLFFLGWLVLIGLAGVGFREFYQTLLDS